MKKILNYIPGYRTKTKWKMIIASIYYAFSLLALTSGIGGFLFFAAAPFVVFSLIDFIKYRKPRYLIVTLISFSLMGSGAALLPDSGQQRLSEPSPTISVSAKPSATATVLPTLKPTSTPIPLPTAIPTPIPTPVPTLPPATAVPTPDTATSANASSASSDTEMVWVGETGNKYHYEDCRSLRGKGHQITMEEALAEGRTSCGICHR